eukprot:g16362.t1
MASSSGQAGTATNKACLNPNCSNEATKRCSKCKVVRFCGPDCQALLWDSHKIFCKSIAKEPEATVLLLDGLGCLGPRNYYTKGAQAALARAGAKVATVDVTKKPGLFHQVGHVLSEAGRFTACIVLNLGADDIEAEEEFAANMNFRQKLCAWVERGGRLIIRSERAIGNWPEWFGKTWKHDDYRRTTHECRAKFRDDVHWCKWYPEAKGAITTTINVKAVMMACVPAEEVLFGTTSSSVSHSLVPTMRGLKVAEGLAAVALGKFGEGLVSFFGDVNAEKTTCKIMAVIACGR